MFWNVHCTLLMFGVICLMRVKMCVSKSRVLLLKFGLHYIFVYFQVGKQMIAFAMSPYCLHFRFLLRAPRQTQISDLEHELFLFSVSSFVSFSPSCSFSFSIRPKRTEPKLEVEKPRLAEQHRLSAHIFQSLGWIGRCGFRWSRVNWVLVGFDGFWCSWAPHLFEHVPYKKVAKPQLVVVLFWARSLEQGWCLRGALWKMAWACFRGRVRRGVWGGGAKVWASICHFDVGVWCVLCLPVGVFYIIVNSHVVICLFCLDVSFALFSNRLCEFFLESSWHCAQQNTNILRE